MHRTPRWLGFRGRLSIGLVVALTTLAFATSALAQGGTVSGDKIITGPGDIPCNGTTTVDLTLTGETGLAGDPEDIMLVLDRSGSMGGAPIANLIVAANTFVDIIDEATDGTLDGVIANGSRVGIVSFNDGFSLDEALTTDADALHSDIDALVAGGGTVHAGPINAAQAQLAGSEPDNTKQMIIFTDGLGTDSGAANTAAANARAAGSEIFAIGLGNADVAQLNTWATDPDATHVFIAPNAAALEDIFEAIGAAIVVPAATDVTIVDTVSSHFTVGGSGVTGGAVAVAGNVLTWTIPELGTETFTLSYAITHDATQPGGVEATNASVTYTDAEGHTVTFPSPTVNVRGCPRDIDLTPNPATNELGTPGQGHAVVGTVTDDFGDPVANITVGFDITAGPNASAPNGSDTTDAAGEADYSYTATQGLAGLGTDSIVGCFVNGAGANVCDTAIKHWVDTTPPVTTCTPTTNPSGNNVPNAGNNPKSGMNPDGFYLLGAVDAVDPNPQITVADSGSSFVAGPYPNGTKIKLTQAPGTTPNVKPGPGVIDWHITLKGDAIVSATDSEGNVSTVRCLVPPPPK